MLVCAQKLLLAYNLFPASSSFKAPFIFLLYTFGAEFHEVSKYF